MKTAILLKLLHSCDTKANPNYKNTASRKGDNGFTLLEVLIIVLILGILSSIAAPSWLAFINRQRVRTVNDRVFQSLRLAQSEAKRTKSDRVVTFKYDPNPPANPVADPPTATINTDPAVTPPLQTLAFDVGGEIKPGTIKLLSNAPSITFDYLGNVKDQLPLDTLNVRRFVVSVAAINGGGKQCAIVETIIGGMRTGEGPECTTTP